MQVFQYPQRHTWSSLLQRPALDAAALEKSTRKVLAKVQQGGDRAVRRFTKQFDGISIRNLAVTTKEIAAAAKQIDPNLRAAIDVAMENIRCFHAAQLREEEVISTMPGIQCWRKMVPIEKVGLYIPGGTAPLFSTLLMLGIPATLAGCKEIVVCSPPDKDGKLHPAILYAAKQLGITKIFKIGGIQAIAAMAYGTETVPQVYKIFGPGNQYVTAAKQLVQQEGVAIDMPAGPSEVCVLADETAVPAFVAADLLSQAEHGADSQVLLVSTSAALIGEVNKCIDEQLQQLPRAEIARLALNNSKAVVLENMQDAIDLVNAYAAEHLILASDDSAALAPFIVNAGSVFVGNYAPESVGDYASGTNHTLPTNGYARAYSGVSVDSFVKKITFQTLSQDGLKAIGNAVVTLAEAEGLTAHAAAVSIRLKNQQ